MSYKSESSVGRSGWGASARRTLAEELRDAILQDIIIAGEVTEGEYLPTEYELVDRYKVSRITIRTALSSLQAAGYILRQQGRGSLVLPRPQTLYWGIEHLRSIETYAATQGLTVTTSDLTLHEAPLDAVAAAKLNRVEGEPAVFVERAKAFDGVTAGWILDIVPSEVLSAEKLEATFAGSVLDVLIAERELNTAYSDCELSAVSVDEDLAAKLHVAPGTPAFFIDEITRAEDGRVLNWSRAWALNSHFTFNLRRKL
ncbi:MAG: GntR family transcriptional regulator [Microbacterium sp.]